MNAGDADAWSAKALAGERFDDADATVWTLRAVGTEGDAPVAFAVVRRVEDELSIAHLAVAPERRRSGLGAELVRALVERARAWGASSVWLEVRDSNAAARGLYASAGFEEMQRRPGFYDGPREAAIVLRLAL